MSLYSRKICHPVVRAVPIAAACAALALPSACGPSPERNGVPVEVVLDRSLTPGTAQHFEVWAQSDGGWYAWSVVPSTPILMERTELWVSQGSTGMHGRARVSRYEESAAVSGVERDEVLDLHGVIRVSEAGVPSELQRRWVAYELDGRRDGEPIHIAGAFGFGSTDLQR